MPLQPLHNENDLLRQVAKDNEKAFRILFDHYWDKIYSMALTYTRSVPQAEDLVQDIFIRVWNVRDKLPDILSFDNWLFILARNTLVNAIRRNVEMLPFTGVYENQPASEEELPDQIYALKESQALIDMAVAELPPQQKRIYQLSRVEGLSHQEIASELGISVSTVKGHMTKALQHIRKGLAASTQRSNIVWLLILTAILEK